MAAKRKEQIADINEICVFWTQIMRDEDADIKERLKVSEYLAKARGLFSGDEALKAEADPFSLLSVGERLALLEEIRSEAAPFI